MFSQKNMKNMSINAQKNMSFQQKFSYDFQEKNLPESEMNL